MPEMNGFELYRQIRMKDNGVKVCFLTALSDLRDYEQYISEAYPKQNKGTTLQNQYQMMNF